jgi:hypothetical protein
MDTKTSTGDTASTIFLTGSIFLANLDFTGLFDYALKAAIGGFMWLVFKMIADGIERRRFDPTHKTPQGRKKESPYDPQKEME